MYRSAKDLALGIGDVNVRILALIGRPKQYRRVMAGIATILESYFRRTVVCWQEYCTPRRLCFLEGTLAFCFYKITHQMCRCAQEFARGICRYWCCKGDGIGRNW